MSTKLNAEELARVKYPTEQTFKGPRFFHTEREAYAAAIREVAQPIADQRDKLLEALEQYRSAFGQALDFHGIEYSEQQEVAELKASAAIAKATQP